MLLVSSMVLYLRANGVTINLQEDIFSIVNLLTDSVTTEKRISETHILNDTIICDDTKQRTYTDPSPTPTASPTPYPFDPEPVMKQGILVIGFFMFVAPPFIIASRKYGEVANLVILLGIMFIGLSLLMTPLQW